MSTQLRDGLMGRKFFPWDLHVCLSILFVVRRILLSVEAERTRRRPEKVNGPMPDRQGMNIPPPVGLRRQRDHWNAPSPKAHLNGDGPALVDANQIQNRHGVPGVRRTRQLVLDCCGARLRKT